MIPVVPSVLHENGKLIRFAENQTKDYNVLPASIDPDGLVMTEWEPTVTELEYLLQGGRVRLWIHTFEKPLQPVHLEVILPECGVRES